MYENLSPARARVLRRRNDVLLAIALITTVMALIHFRVG